MPFFLGAGGGVPAHLRWKRRWIGYGNSYQVLYGFWGLGYSVKLYVSPSKLNMKKVEKSTQIKTNWHVGELIKCWDYYLSLSMIHVCFTCVTACDSSILVFVHLSQDQEIVPFYSPCHSLLFCSSRLGLSSHPHLQYGLGSFPMKLALPFHSLLFFSSGPVGSVKINKLWEPFDYHLSNLDETQLKPKFCHLQLHLTSNWLLSQATTHP